VRALDAARIATAIDYATVRSLKHDALQRSFAHFRETEWTSDTRRASAFRAFCEHQAWWLEDYALFRALHARFGERSWLEWPEPMRDRDPDALAAAREELAGRHHVPAVPAVGGRRSVGAGTRSRR
jgi:4-alpha-glucanotransferase